MRIESKHSSLALALLIVSGLVMALVPAVLANATVQPTADNVSTLLASSHSGRAEEVFNFPADHVLHQPESVVKNIELFVEWLYWSGVVKDVETGDLYGFQYTLFHQYLPPLGIVGYFNHAAVSDVRNSQHPRYRYLTLPGQANVTNGTDNGKGAYWRYRDASTTLTYWKDSDAWNIVTQGNVSKDGHGQNISLNLTLVNDKADYYLHQPNGIHDQGDCPDTDSEYMAGRSYYYSHPAMTVTGTLTIDGRLVNVSGDSWFDHQWGGYGKCYMAWDWFSMRLDDGSSVMLYNMKDSHLNDILSQRNLTYIDPKGKVSWWYGEDAANLTVTRWWTSDLFGFKYPLDWVIDTTVGKFAMEPYFDEQTMNVGEGEVKYWEGVMRVRKGDLSGKQIGIGYMELTGYAPRFSQQVSKQNSS